MTGYDPWFPIARLRAAVDEIERRYPGAECARSPVGQITFTAGPADDDPQVGYISLLDGSVNYFSGAESAGENDEADDYVQDDEVDESPGRQVSHGKHEREDAP